MPNFSKRNYIVRDDENQAEKENPEEKKSNDSNINNMVGIAEITEIAIDTLVLGGANSVAGRSNNMNDMGKFVLSDTIYEYVLDDQIERIFGRDFLPKPAPSDTTGGKALTAGITLANINVSKIVGLGLARMMVNMATGSPAKAQSAFIDSAIVGFLSTPVQFAVSQLPASANGS